MGVKEVVTRDQSDGTTNVTVPNLRTSLSVPSVADVNFALPTNAISQTFPRNTQANANATALVSGRLTLVALPLRNGQTVNSISFISGATAASVPLNQWFCLYDSARGKLAVTADDTTTAWAANAVKTLTLSSPYAVTADGLYYVGIVVVATTVPTLGATPSDTRITNPAPILVGSSTSALTLPSTAPTTAAALTALANIPYAYVS